MPTIIKKKIEKYNKLKLYIVSFFYALNIPNIHFVRTQLIKKEIQQMDNMQIINKRNNNLSNGIYAHIFRNNSCWPIYSS